MKKIKVLLQYPWKFPDSSYYKNMLDHSPKKVEFVNYKKSSQKKMEIIGSSKKFEQMRKFKNFLRKILSFLRLPNLTYNLRNDFDIIHCAHCLSLNNKPWVVDTEVYDRVAATGSIASSKIGYWIIKNRLESQNCKKIIAWSEDCKKTFIDAFPNSKKILGKLTIVPFAFKTPKFDKIKHDNINILFLARWFDAKGGRQTLEVFDRLSKKYNNVEFTFICPTPNKYRKKYADNKAINIMDLIPQERVFREFYPKADIFFYPGFGDSYGFAVPEALGFGLPVISTKSFAKSEIVKDGKTGFLIDMPKNWGFYKDMNEKFLQDLYDKTSILIEDNELRKKFGKEALKVSKRGGLHNIEDRNQKLRRVYEEALK
jgi:glycosyltransferase involved in cell wall biosynthesis